MTLSPGIHHLAPTLPVHVLEADEPGPTAIVQAAIHGDEIAGAHALMELVEEGYAPQRGRLLIIPVMNPPAYRARQRARPGGLDLNRCFPGDPESEHPEQRLAHRFMELIRAERPALVATLHESTKRYHPSVAASFGQTLVYGVKPVPPILSRVVAQLNEALEHPYEVWDTHYYPVATSSTEVIVDAIGCVGVCVETWMGFDERRRIDMQRSIVDFLLRDIGIVS